MTESLVNKIKLVLEKCDSYETKSIYKVLLDEEFQIGEQFALKVELDNQELSLRNAVGMVKSRILSVKVRTNIWKLFHNVVYDDILKGKVANSTPDCKLCTAADIDRLHVYFSCEKYRGCGQDVLKVLSGFGEYDGYDVLNMKISYEIHHLTWLLGNYLYFVTVRREKCSPEHFKVFLLSEFEVLRRTKFCDSDLATSLMILIEQIGLTDQ